MNNPKDFDEFYARALEFTSKSELHLSVMSKIHLHLAKLAEQGQFKDFILTGVFEEDTEAFDSMTLFIFSILENFSRAGLISYNEVELPEFKQYGVSDHSEARINEVINLAISKVKK